MVVTAGAEAASAAHANSIDPSALDEIAASQDALDKLSDALQEKMKDFHKAQESFESAVKKQAKVIKGIQASQRAQAAQRKARRATLRKDTSTPESPSSSSSSSSSTVPSSPSSSSASSSSSKIIDESSDIQFAKRLESLKERFRERQTLMPRTGGTFVEFVLGSINVRFARKSERLAFKSEYELMKLKFAPFGVFFCIVCLLLPGYRWVHMMFQLCLSWYYVTLAIRENILRVNGSNIRTWWIIHHYLTMMQGVLLLTWPDGESYAQFRTPLHIFGLYNGILMIFQTRYQMARLYALRSLGMANEMDVASSDNTQIHWSETMTMLLPLVFFGQLMQGYMAVFLFRLSRRFVKEFQIFLLASLFSANFVGNVLTTVQVVLAKRKTRKQRRQHTNIPDVSKANGSIEASVSDTSATHQKES